MLSGLGIAYMDVNDGGTGSTGTKTVTRDLLGGDREIRNLGKVSVTSSDGAGDDDLIRHVPSLK
jgi:hypothetical protein